MIDEKNFAAKKSLGQNFIFDLNLTDKIDEDICINIISIFESNANLHYEGKIIGKGGEYDQVDTSRKKSIDFEFSDLDITEGDFNYKVIEDYYNSLKDVLFNYTETFPEVNTIPYFRANFMYIFINKQFLIIF